jgi:hypothetical protein
MNSSVKFGFSIMDKADEISRTFCMRNNISFLILFVTRLSQKHFWFQSLSLPAKTNAADAAQKS